MESGTQMTLEEYMPETFQKQIAGVSDSHVKTSPLQESNLGFKETVQACFEVRGIFSQIPSQFQGNRSSLFFRVMYLIGQLEEEIDPLTFSLRTLRICLVLMEDGISPDCSLKWSRGV